MGAISYKISKYHFNANFRLHWYSGLIFENFFNISSYSKDYQVYTFTLRFPFFTFRLCFTNNFEKHSQAFRTFIDVKKSASYGLSITNFAENVHWTDFTNPPTLKVSFNFNQYEKNINLIYYTLIKEKILNTTFRNIGINRDLEEVNAKISEVKCLYRINIFNLPKISYKALIELNKELYVPRMKLYVKTKKGMFEYDALNKLIDLKGNEFMNLSLENLLSSRNIVKLKPYIRKAKINNILGKI